MTAFIYPSETFNIKNVDEHFKEEYNLFKEKGFNVCLVDLDDEQISGNFNVDESFIYRGWMLSEREYDLLEKLMANRNASLLTNKESYYESHYLKNQYSDHNKEGISKYSPETHFCTKEDAFDVASKLGWKSFFIKDYVKSLTTERGSIAKLNEVNEVIDQIEYYRGSIEGGISIRKIESFIEDTEVRYFVFKGNVFSPNGKFHKIVENINQIHKEEFFSLDIILDENGKEWIVEIGDGQVSDLKGKGWSTEDFVNIFK
jgi:hypothetical protein